MLVVMMRVIVKVDSNGEGESDGDGNSDDGDGDGVEDHIVKLVEEVGEH